MLPVLPVLPLLALRLAVDVDVAAAVAWDEVVAPEVLPLVPLTPPVLLEVELTARVLAEARLELPCAPSAVPPSRPEASLAPLLLQPPSTAAASPTTLHADFIGDDPRPRCPGRQPARPRLNVWPARTSNG
jgi:hypothetical protein